MGEQQLPHEMISKAPGETETWPPMKTWLGLFLKIMQNDVIVREIGYYIAVFDTTDNSLEQLDRPRFLNRIQYKGGWPIRWNRARLRITTYLTDYAL